MGFRYRATVTFPVAAMQIEEVKKVVDENYRGDIRSLTAVDDEGTESGTVVLSDDQANYGNMEDITDVLLTFAVPYDQYHSESEGSSSIPWTEYVRYDDTSIQLDEVQEAEALTGREMLKMLDEGDLASLRSELQKLADDVPPDLDDSWEPDPAIVAAAREENAS